MGSKLLTIDELSKLTKISKYTLRNWEKRYSFLKTIRTEKDYRLYPPSEVDRLLKIKKLVDQGIRIRNAIEKYHLNEKEPSQKIYSYKKITYSNKQDDFIWSYLKENNFPSLLSWLEGEGFEITRICLAKRIGYSNEYQVVQSSDRTILNSDLMSVYYRCFVSKKSSLNDTKQTTLRVCHDIDQAVLSYKNKPIQKSLHYISKLGHKSSLAVPLFHHQEIVGFFYLNSSEKNYFNNTIERLTPLISTLKKYISESNLLIPHPYHFDIIQKLNKRSLSGEIYSREHFLKSLITFSLVQDLSNVKFIDSLVNRDFLYTPYYSAFIIGHLLSCFDEHNIKFRIDLIPRFNDAVRFEIYIESRKTPYHWCNPCLNAKFSELEKFVSDFGARIKRKERFLWLDIPVEYSFEQNDLYSLLL